MDAGSKCTIFVDGSQVPIHKGHDVRDQGGNRYRVLNSLLKKKGKQKGRHYLLVMKLQGNTQHAPGRPVHNVPWDFNQVLPVTTGDKQVTRRVTPLICLNCSHFLRPDIGDVGRCGYRGGEIQLQWGNCIHLKPIANVHS